MKCEKKGSFLLFKFILTILYVSCWADEEKHVVNRVIHNTHQQVGYGVSWKPGSHHDIVEYSDDIAGILENGVKHLMLKRFDICNAEVYNVSTTCMNDTLTMLQDILNGTSYATNMLDSDGKPGSGIAHGNLVWLGNRQQCQQAKTDKFRGQMCDTFTNIGYPAMKLYLSFAGCFPDSCSETDIKLLVWDVLKPIDEKLKVVIYPILVDCSKPLEYSSGDIVAIVVCIIICLAAVIGTLTDIVYMYLDQNTEVEGIKVRSDSTHTYSGSSSINEASERTGLLTNVSKNNIVYSENVSSTCCTGTFKQILISFSVISNTRKLLNTTTASGSLTAVNGMRVFSMWWVILGHTYAFNITFTDNYLDMAGLVMRFSFQCILNGTFSVDTFFFMSGLLVAYTVMKKLKDQVKINWGMFYFHRFWRLTPVYAFGIMVWSTLYKHWVWTGPYTAGMKQEGSAFEYCDKYWWSNILYINNFFPNYGNIAKQCMGWGWYLANDMQFYILSPLFLLLLYKARSIGTGVVLFSIFGCIVSRVITAEYYGVRLPNMNMPLNHTTEAWASSSPLYNKPYTRIAPFLVGLLLGHLLVINNNRVRLGKLKLLIGWIVAITIGMSVIYGMYGFYKDFQIVHLGQKTESLFYIGLSRFAWSIALAWVIFVCAVGHGGPVQAFLSWKVWAPIGRLTYCAYIVHPAVIYYFALNNEKPIHYTDAVFIQLYVSMVVISYGVAFIFSILVEAPMLGLEKVLLKKWIR